MTGSIKTNALQQTKVPLFGEYDCVVLKKDIKGTNLRKGDGGTVMDVYASGLEVGIPVAYEVEFDREDMALKAIETKKYVTKGIPEKYLKADTSVWPTPKVTVVATPTMSAKPPQMPENVSQADR